MSQIDTTERVRRTLAAEANLLAAGFTFEVEYEGPAPGCPCCHALGDAEEARGATAA